MNENQLDLSKAEVRSTCGHVLDEVDPSTIYGRVWEEDEAVIVCKPCYDEVGAAVISHLMQMSSRTRTQAEQFFAEHSLVTESSDAVG